MSKKNNPPGILPAILAFLFVAVTWCANYYILVSLPDRGTFGDMFGAANAIFSGLAFAGVVYAIFLQRAEVSIAKEEISRTKAILEEQQKAANLQFEAQSKQIFENTFFNLLRLYSEIVSDLDLRDATNNVTASGKDLFPIFWKRLEKRVEKNNETILEAYETIYPRLSNELGHYFRTLYNLVKFVDSSDVPNKRLYTNLIRAQLSNAEIDILLVNGLSPRGIERFKPLLEKYSLLKNASKTNSNISDLLIRYDKSAF